MKYRHISLVLAIAALGLFFVSCKSTGGTSGTSTTPPAAAPSQGATTPSQPAASSPDRPDQAALDALGQALGRAESARKRAADFESSSYFPVEWESAESDYNAVGTDRATTAGVRESERRYNAVADKYDELFRNTLPLYARELEDEVLQARAAAIAAGITDVAPEYLVAADRTAIDADDSYQGEDYYKASELAHEALDRYRSLAAGVDAYQVRNDVLRRDFSGFDADNFSRADEVLIAGADAYEAGNIETALSSAEESKLRYNLVLKAGWASYAAQLQVLARRERQNALNAKANVAVKDDFSGVEQTFTQAESSFRTEEYETAAGLYIRSEAGFVAVAQAAEEKRRIAEAALQAAEEKLAESDSVARAGEEILEGGAE
jgi:hypothetical protein